MSLTKVEVAEIFRYAWADAAAAKYGDVFTERGERVVADLLRDHREAVVAVLGDWIADSGERATCLLAVRLAARFEPPELLGDVQALAAVIRDGRASPRPTLVRHSRRMD